MEDDVSRIVFLKLYARGKITGISEGPKEWHEQVRRAMEGALSMRATLDLDRFEQAMRRQDVPEEMISLFKEKVWLDDDAYTAPTPYP